MMARIDVTFKVTVRYNMSVMIQGILVKQNVHIMK